MRKLVMLALVPFFLMGCSKHFVPYTQSLQEDYNWNENEIRRIQFYTSEDIVLQRKAQNSQTEIVSGTIKIVDGKKVEEIVIKKGTPGIAVGFPDDERIGVSFEIDDTHYLTFGPNPNKGKKFYLYAADWNNRIGKVAYNDYTFYTSPESSGVFLVVDMKKLKEWDIEQRVATGRKVK